MMPDFDPQTLEFLGEFTPPPKLPGVDENVQATVQGVMERHRKQQGRKTIEEAEEAAKMGAARRELEGSILPWWRAYGVTAGAPIVSTVARLIGKGEYADEAIHAAARIEQAQREREKGGVVPDILQRGARGALASFTTMAPAGMVGGPYAAISSAAIQEANRSITTGKGAGKKGQELASYVISKGIWEALPAAAMQRVGLGGFEKIFNKGAVSQATSVGLRQGMKRLGVMAAEEFFEENLTEVVHLAIDDVSRTDPGAFTLENISQTVAETTVQTGIMVAFGGAPGVARSVQAEKAAKVMEEARNYAREGKVPSRKTFREWNLAPEMGSSRGQRKAFIQELASQLDGPLGAPIEGEQAPVEPPGMVPEAPGAPEAAVPAPVAAAPVPGAPEGIETGVEPAAVQEAPGAVGMPGVAVEAEIVPEPPVRPEVLGGLEPPANEVEAVGLSKAEGAEIRRIMGHEQLPEGEARSAVDVMEKVAVGRGDEKALDTAQEVIRNPRMLEPYEHVSMVLKARKLMKDSKAARVEQSRASQAGDEGAFRKATADREVISQQLAILTEGAQYSGTEVSEAFSIRKLQLSLESYDIVDVMQEIQAIKKPGADWRHVARTATSLTDEHSDLIGKIDERKEELRILDEKKEAALAEKVLAAHKPKKKIGKGIRERSVARQNEFKERIRQMGLRVNDITGVTVEGTYLIGRVGIEYIVQGAGTLVEVAEKLRADFPDLTITDHDVNQALVMRSPKEKTRVRSEATKRKARLLSMARMHVEIENLSRGIATAAKKKAAVPEDMKKLQKLLKKARHDYYYSELEAAKIERAVDRLNLLQSQLDNDIKRAKKDPKDVSPGLEKINEKIRQVTKEMTVKEKLAEAEEQLRTGKVTAPPKRVLKPIDPELERLQIKLEQKRSEIRQLIADQSPWTIGKIADEVFESLRTLMATGEVSFTLRQNFLQSFSHPVKAIERFARSIVPIFSRNSATQINNRLKDSPNAAIYERSRLAILDSESPDIAQRSEVFKANIIQKVPILGSVIRASARHGVAYSNFMRTSGMDGFVGMWPNATRAELNAWANFQNTCSGLGSLWVFAQAAGVVRRVFFAAKFAASRPQTPYRMFQYWNMPRVRNAIAKDMVRAVATGIGFMSLCALGGAELTDWDDVDNADWGKIRIGNTRFDIWGSYLQPARLIARILRGGAVRLNLVEPGYGAIDPLDLIGRFAAFKLSPPVSIVRELWTGKTAVGGETTLVGTAARHTTMMFLQDVYDAAREYNSIPAGAGVGFVAGTGIGAATYKDSESATRQKIRRFQGKGEPASAEKLFWEWNNDPENIKDQISRKWFLDTKK